MKLQTKSDLLLLGQLLLILCMALLMNCTSALGDVELPRVEMTDGGYARLVFSNPRPMECLCCEAFKPHVQDRCHRRTDGGWAEVIP